MTILALEFSSERRGVALLRDGALLAEVVHHGTRETPLFAMISEALARADLDRRDVGTVAVGLGPGSYTGIRLAISVAQGWQLGTGVRTLGVGSFEVMASLAPPGEDLLLAVDSQRDEFAVVEVRERRLVGTPRLVSSRRLQEEMARGVRVAGPDLPAGLAGAGSLHPTAATLARLAHGREAIPAELLTPVYLREAAFVKTSLSPGPSSKRPPAP